MSLKGCGGGDEGQGQGTQPPSLLRHRRRGLSWGQTVESYGDKYMQVPCVIIDTGEKVVVQPLAQHRYSYEIEVKQ